MNPSKLQLSSEEMAMVKNQQWLLTKNSILAKVNELFAECAERIRIPATEANMSQEMVWVQSPKIARGENYLGLPYVMLDYPRYFGKDDRLAIRTMFWWGNFISCTLHLSGIYVQRCKPGIIDAFSELSDRGYRKCISADEWRHDMEPDNYQFIETMSIEKLTASFSDVSFVKIAVVIRLDQWNDAAELIYQHQLFLLKVAGFSFPADGISLSPGNPKVSSGL